MDGHNERDKSQADVQHRVSEAVRISVLRAVQPRGRQIRVAYVRAAAHVLHATPGRASTCTSTP